MRAVEDPVAEQALRDVLAVAPDGARVIHCCADDVPFDVLRNAGVDAISIDASRLEKSVYDALGETVESGTSLWLGVLPAVDAPVSFDAARERLRMVWSELGFALTRLASDVVPTPTCGLAGASQDHVRRVFHALRELAKWLPEAAEQ